MFKNRFSLFVAAFVIIGFFFLALPEKGYSGIPIDFGCCRTQNLQNCIGCESGCAITENFCDDIEGEFFVSQKGRICVDEGKQIALADFSRNQDVA